MSAKPLLALALVGGVLLFASRPEKAVAAPAAPGAPPGPPGPPSPPEPAQPPSDVVTPGPEPPPASLPPWTPPQYGPGAPPAPPAAPPTTPAAPPHPAPPPSPRVFDPEKTDDPVLGKILLVKWGDPILLGAWWFFKDAPLTEWTSVRGDKLKAWTDYAGIQSRPQFPADIVPPNVAQLFEGV